MVLANEGTRVTEQVASCQVCSAGVWMDECKLVKCFRRWLEEHRYGKSQVNFHYNFRAPCRWTQGHVSWQCQPNLKPWRKLPLVSVWDNRRHPVPLNHLISSYAGDGDFPLCQKKCSVTTLMAGVGTRSIWYSNTFFHNISSVLCSVNSKPTRCCSVKAVMLQRICHRAVSQAGPCPNQPHISWWISWLLV